MASKKHNPGCPCCGDTLPCECPGGGLSRKFVGVPTIFVTIEDLVDQYIYDCTYQISSPGLTLKYWETVQLDGMASWNGTYAHPLVKTEDGCIDFIASANKTFAPANATITRTERVIATPGCSVSSTTDRSAQNISIVFDIIRTTASGRFQVNFMAGFERSVSTSVVTYFQMGGLQRLHCKKDYDPTADTAKSVLGAGVDTLLTVEYTPADQPFGIVHLPNFLGECISPYSIFYQPLGYIRAEVIDDV